MNYITAVAEEIGSRCRHLGILSPMDFLTIAEWEKQGIPLLVVMQSINEFSEHLERESDVYASFSALNDLVQRNFRDWLLNA